MYLVLVTTRMGDLKMGLSLPPHSHLTAMIMLQEAELGEIGGVWESE